MTEGSECDGGVSPLSVKALCNKMTFQDLDYAYAVKRTGEEAYFLGPMTALVSNLGGSIIQPEYHSNFITYRRQKKSKRTI